MATTFPSVEWFQELADITNGDEVFRKFGRLDAIIAFKIGDRAFNVTFDVLTAGDIREIEDEEMRDSDFIIELSLDQWQGMLEDIKANGTASKDWTLNTLDLINDDPIHRNMEGDGYRADFFFRYNPSLQRFIENASQMETTFDLAGAPA